MKKDTLLCYILPLLIITFPQIVFAQNRGIIIVNKGVPIDSTTEETLKKIYLGKIQTWDNGITIQPVIPNPENELTKKFMKEILHKTYTYYMRYWRKTIFAGYGLPPKQISTIDEVIQFVEQHRGGISFVPVSYKSKLKEIKIIKLGSKNTF